MSLNASKILLVTRHTLADDVNALLTSRDASGIPRNALISIWPQLPGIQLSSNACGIGAWKSTHGNS